MINDLVTLFSRGASAGEELGRLKIVEKNGLLRIYRVAGFRRGRDFKLVDYERCRLLEFTFRRKQELSRLLFSRVTLNYEIGKSVWHGLLQREEHDDLAVGAYIDPGCRLFSDK